nr:hypothetical protein [Tanacetum cinerariifolium]
MLDDLGTKPSDSKNELNLRTFSVMNETDGSGGMEGLSLCCFGRIVMGLIKPWIWVEHCGSSVSVSSILVGILPLSDSSPSYLRTAISNYGVSLGIRGWNRLPPVQYRQSQSEMSTISK